MPASCQPANVMLCGNLLRYDTIQYDTRCYFYVRSKADISQLNLPHGTKLQKSGKKKNKKVKNGYDQKYW